MLNVHKLIYKVQEEEYVHCNMCDIWDRVASKAQSQPIYVYYFNVEKQ